MKVTYKEMYKRFCELLQEHQADNITVYDAETGEFHPVNQISIEGSIDMDTNNPVISSIHLVYNMVKSKKNPTYWDLFGVIDRYKIKGKIRVQDEDSCEWNFINDIRIEDGSKDVLDEGCMYLVIGLE